MKKLIVELACDSCENFCHVKTKLNPPFTEEDIPECCIFDPTSPASFSVVSKEEVIKLDPDDSILDILAEMSDKQINQVNNIVYKVESAKGLRILHYWDRLALKYDVVLAWRYKLIDLSEYQAYSGQELILKLGDLHRRIERKENEKNKMEK